MRTRSLLLAAIILFATAAASHAQGKYTPWSTPVNLGAVINTTASEFSPCISKDGLSMYFAGPGLSVDGLEVRHSVGGYDIFVSRRSSLDDSWGPPENLGEPINSAYDEVSPNLSIDGHRMYFASNRPGGYGGNDIYVTRRHNKRDDLGWQAPENLGPGVNTAANEAGPFVFEDESTGAIALYFDSNRPDGPGPYTEDVAHNGNDIYTSLLQADEAFGPAVLVEELSTTSPDRKPAIRRDGLELILSSSRPGCLGAIDLWVSTRESTSDPWSTPTNMGPTINGPHGQGVAKSAQTAGAAFSFDGLSIYFQASWNAHVGYGAYDLVVSTRSRVRGSDRDDR